MPIRALGLDMGGSFDMAAISVIGVEEDGTAHVRQHSWLSRSGFDTFASKVPLQSFVDRGELTVEGADAVSSELIASEIADIANAIDVQEVAVDPAYLTVIGPMLESYGLELREARQGTMSMSSVMHAAEERISEGKLCVGDDSLMVWALGNTGIVSNSTGRRPCKIGNDSSVNPNKIDAVSAMLTGWQLVNEQQFAEGSAYGARPGQVDTICPWIDPVSAIAIQQGGIPMPILYFPTDTETGAWLLA
jgi:phage terminase large subunit-like protein